MKAMILCVLSRQTFPLKLLAGKVRSELFLCIGTCAALTLCNVAVAQITNPTKEKSAPESSRNVRQNLSDLDDLLEIHRKAEKRRAKRPTKPRPVVPDTRGPRAAWPRTTCECLGSGRCVHCNGGQKSKYPFPGSYDCPDCNGRGICSQCHGRG